MGRAIAPAPLDPPVFKRLPKFHSNESLFSSKFKNTLHLSSLKNGLTHQKWYFTFTTISSFTWEKGRRMRSPFCAPGFSYFPPPFIGLLGCGFGADPRHLQRPPYISYDTVHTFQKPGTIICRNLYVHFTREFRYWQDFVDFFWPPFPSIYLEVRFPHFQYSHSYNTYSYRFLPISVPTHYSTLGAMQQFHTI